ncbi:hypothetical protein LCGC14_2875330, partial [marine sediment metagenome]
HSLPSLCFAVGTGLEYARFPLPITNSGIRFGHALTLAGGRKGGYNLPLDPGGLSFLTDFSA